MVWELYEENSGGWIHHHTHAPELIKIVPGQVKYLTCTENTEKLYKRVELETMFLTDRLAVDKIYFAPNKSHYDLLTAYGKKVISNQVKINVHESYFATPSNWLTRITGNRRVAETIIILVIAIPICFILNMTINCICKYINRTDD
jgi:hypothetical protein